MAKPSTFTECNSASVRDAAEFYASQKLPTVKILSREKKPFEKSWQLLNYNTPKKAAAAFANHDGNIGIRGDESGLIGIDFDDEKFKAAMLAELPMLADTLQSMGHKTTGHYWLRLTKPLKNESIRLHFADRTKQTFADLRGIGGQIVVAPSIHPEGDRYKWLNDNPILPLDTDVFLAALDAACAAVGAKNPYRKGDAKQDDQPTQGENIFAKVKSAISIQQYLGTRTERINCPIHKEKTPAQAMRIYPATQSCYCFSCGFAGDVISLYAKQHNIGQLAAAQALAAKYGIPTTLEKSKSSGFDEEGLTTSDLQDFAAVLRGINDDCLKTRSNPKIKLITSAAKWLRDNIPLYTFSDTNEVLFYDEEKGHYVGGGREFLAGKIQSALEIAGLSDHASRFFVEEILGNIRRATYIKREDFTESLDYIPLANGIYDTAQQEFIPFSSKFRFLSKFPTKYDPDATCPAIDKFVSEIFPDNELNQKLFFEIAGSCLFRKNREQKAFAFVGEGSNGKSTATAIIRVLLGSENTTSISLQEVEEDRFAVANLYGKSANLVADMASRDLKGTSRFKAATGGDLLRAQNKGGQPFFFVSFARWIISCNKLPKSGDDMRAFYRRWIILLFNQNFEERDDKNLLSKLTTSGEMSGLLNKSIAAYVGVLKQGGFCFAPNSAEIRKLYVHLSDSATAFCEDMLVSDDGDLGIGKDELWHTYLKFCKIQSLTKVSEKKFWETLPELFEIYIYRPSGENRARRIRGIRFKSGSPTSPAFSNSINGEISPTSPICPTFYYSEKHSENTTGERGKTLDITDYSDKQQQPLITLKVLFQKSTPQWVGSDGRTYGAFQAGQVAELPASEAEFLLNAGLAQAAQGGAP